uniref:Uncharacterized protein n=1 Tax=Timema poppense TaxID=170557 RepID=A0A7R9DCJ7_TIMPO|nr:unnamed protein product [Timema poppensis]
MRRTDFLQRYIREFLCLVPHNQKFCFSETADVLHRSASTKEDFSGYRAASAWNAIGAYAGNLLAQPWRKEYREMKAMAGPSSRLNDSDILDYLDTIDSDSDFVYESDSDITSDDDNVPDLRNPAVHNQSDSDENGMDDEDYREILSPEQSLPLPFT